MFCDSQSSRSSRFLCGLYSKSTSSSNMYWLRQPSTCRLAVAAIARGDMAVNSLAISFCGTASASSTSAKARGNRAASVLNGAPGSTTDSSERSLMAWTNKELLIVMTFAYQCPSAFPATSTKPADLVRKRLSNRCVQRRVTKALSNMAHERARASALWRTQPAWPKRVLFRGRTLAYCGAPHVIVR